MCWATISPGDPPALAFALIRDDAAAELPAGSSREMRLEAHMLRMADELHAAGLMPRLHQLPTLTDEPQFSKLTSREWAVLTRLLYGQRVAAIAADLYVSQSTVRNHRTRWAGPLPSPSQLPMRRKVQEPWTMRGEPASLFACAGRAVEWQRTEGPGLAAPGRLEGRLADDRAAVDGTPVVKAVVRHPIPVICHGKAVKA